MEENGKVFLCPRATVRLPHHHPNVSRGQRVLITKMIAELPDNVWYQENPDKLPGVPMTDIAIRIHLQHNNPIYRKVLHMSPEQRVLARAEIDNG